MKIAIAVLLVASLISSGFGTVWSTRPVITQTDEEKENGLFNAHVHDTWLEANRGALCLGFGLILTTAAGILALTL